jgi:cell division protein FtsN
MATRDYKRSRGRGESMTATTGFALGAAVGLGIGLAIYLLDRPQPDAPGARPAPASTQASETPPAEPEQNYDFYEMLPNFEVVVPEREKDVKVDAPAAAVQKAGAYVLQVGSYRAYEEADRVRAQLALQGIESKVQRVSVDSDTWHRVRIGPISDLTELNRVRTRLREAEMDVLVIRVGD